MRIPLLRLPDQGRILRRGHKQHPQQRRGAQPLPLRRASRGDGAVQGARQEGWTDFGIRRGALALLHRQLQGEPAHHPVLLAHRRGVQGAAPAVPLARQLLHHRLVPRVAQRRVGGGGFEDLSRRGRPRRGAPKAARHVQEFPQGGGRALRGVPRQGGAAQLRHAHVLPRAAQHVHLVVGQAERGRLQRKAEVRGWSGEARLHRGCREGHAGRAHGAQTQPDQDGRRDGGTHGEGAARKGGGCRAEEGCRRRGGCRGGQEGRGGGGGEKGVRGSARRGHPRARSRRRRAGHHHGQGHQVRQLVQEPAGDDQVGAGVCVRGAGCQARQGARSGGYRQDDRRLLAPVQETPHGPDVHRSAPRLRQGQHRPRDHGEAPHQVHRG